uniref:Saposin B-type domain-containing protein n=1 Tax=Anopheles coluzzii TaxID=1518534 RepID=A0A8W7PX27_ANOCL
MNPNAVCSVAGLCNNAAIDKLLSEMIVLNPEQEVQGIEANEREPAVTGDTFNCDECHTISNLIQKRFRSTDRDSVLESILQICGKMSSYSDACSNIVLTYFGVMYEHLERNLKVEGVCHLSGVCAAQFHLHENNKRKDLIEARSMGDVGRLRVAGDDVPCKLCEQLVDHLRDVLIANTTELEFKEVLEGLCNQTKSFADECHSLVEQYYREIYETLVNNLNSNDACFIIGICPKEDGVVNILVSSSGDIETNEIPDITVNGEITIDHTLMSSSPECLVCQEMVKEVEKRVQNKKSKEQIKQALEHACDRLRKYKTKCEKYIDQHSDQIIDLVMKQLSPKEICNALGFCIPAQEIIDDCEYYFSLI